MTHTETRDQQLNYILALLIDGSNDYMREAIADTFRDTATARAVFNNYHINIGDRVRLLVDGLVPRGTTGTVTAAGERSVTFLMDGYNPTQDIGLGSCMKWEVEKINTPLLLPAGLSWCPETYAPVVPVQSAGDRVRFFCPHCKRWHYYPTTGWVTAKCKSGPLYHRWGFKLVLSDASH
jgi:hypothetical protein